MIRKTIAKRTSRTTIFQFEPKTIGMGPMKIIPPALIDFSTSTLFSGKSSLLKLNDFIKARVKNKKAKNKKTMVKKPYNPVPVMNGKTTKIPPLRSPDEKPRIRETIKPMKQIMEKK